MARKTRAISAIAAMSRQRSTMPSALAKTPTETCWYQDEGEERPMILAPPESEETGASIPDKVTAGTMDRIAVAKTAATCVR